MKAKVIIENGITTIELTPENDFEKRVLKDAHSNSNYEFDTKVTSNYSYGENNYKLNVELKVK